MGMVVSLSGVRDETIERLLADPPLVWQLIAPDDPDAYDRARREADGRARPGGCSETSPEIQTQE